MGSDLPPAEREGPVKHKSVFTGCCVTAQAQPALQLDAQEEERGHAPGERGDGAWPS